MGFTTIVFQNNFRADEDTLMDIAEKIAKITLSELPEEIQTYEGAEYILEKAKKKLKTMKITL